MGLVVDSRQWIRIGLSTSRANAAAITLASDLFCRGRANSRAPILLVTHEKGDHSWQFLDGGTMTTKDAAVVGHGGDARARSNTRGDRGPSTGMGRDAGEAGRTVAAKLRGND